MMKLLEKLVFLLSSAGLAVIMGVVLIAVLFLVFTFLYLNFIVSY
jgi:hypothetical protein